MQRKHGRNSQRVKKMIETIKIGIDNLRLIIIMSISININEWKQKECEQSDGCETKQG